MKLNLSSNLKQVGDAVKEKASNLSDAVKERAGNLGDTVKETAHQIGDSAKAKGMEIIEGWVAILPALEGYGLKKTSFGLALSLNPCLDVELEGEAALFTPDYVAQLVEETKDSAYLKFVFNAVKTTVSLHKGAGSSPIEPLLIKMQIKLSPEIRVYLGRPNLN